MNRKNSWNILDSRKKKLLRFLKMTVVDHDFFFNICQARGYVYSGLFGLFNAIPLLLSSCFLGCTMYVSEADPICALQVISFLKKCILKLATAFKHSKEFMTNVHHPIPSIAMLFGLFQRPFWIIFYYVTTFL